MTLMTSTGIMIGSVEFQASHPKLHHYTAKPGLEGIIKSNSLWATRYRDLNDSAEIIHLKTPLAEALVPRFDAIIERQNPNRHLRKHYEKTGGSAKLARDLVEQPLQRNLRRNWLYLSRSFCRFVLHSRE